MDLRHILVPMAGDDADRLALDTAGRVAGRFGTHVTVLFAEPDARDIPMAMVGDATGGYLSRDLVRTLETRIESRRTSAQAAFAEWQRSAELETVSAPRDGGASTKLVLEVGSDAVLVRSYGLVSDMIVTVLPGTSEVERSVFVETALFEAGKPVLTVPRGGKPLRLESPLVQIAWRQGPESARALTAALPLLKLAGRVIVSQAVNPGDQPTVAPVIEHLGWHGINAETALYPGPRSGERLLAEAERKGVDLLVLGAYVHSRARALVFGGVTRHVLENSSIPVLFAH